MKILYFAPVATKNDPSLCPFITQRIIELKKNNIEVEVLQYGRISFFSDLKRNHFFPIYLVKVIYFFLFSKIWNNTKKINNLNITKFVYYDKLFFISYKSFSKWFKKNKFGLIHCHFLWFADKLPIIKQYTNIPYVITVHGSDLHEINTSNKNKVAKILNILNNSNKNIFISNYLLSYAKKLGYSLTNYTIIYNGINHNLFKINKIKHTDWPVLGFVGHPIFIKRVDILPYVLKNVHKVYPKAKLLMVGSSEESIIYYVNKLIQELNLNNFVEIIPSVPPYEVAKYMNQMDVLLFPSRSEGFGCVAIEAQACGIGVIGSKIGGIPEAIGSNGICVEDTDNFTRDFSNAVIKWLKKKHNSEEIANSVKDYTWENCVNQEINTYLEILNINNS